MTPSFTRDGCARSATVDAESVCNLSNGNTGNAKRSHFAHLIICQLCAVLAMFSHSLSGNGGEVEVLPSFAPYSIRQGDIRNANLFGDGHIQCSATNATVGISDQSVREFALWGKFAPGTSSRKSTRKMFPGFAGQGAHHYAMTNPRFIGKGLGHFPIRITASITDNLRTGHLRSGVSFPFCMPHRDMTRKMPPALARNRGGHSGFSNFKILSDKPSGFSELITASHLKHIVRFELGAVCVFSDVAILATLADHIIGVVLNCSDKQVIGAHARWVVAMVTDEQAIRDGSVEEQPCNTMSAIIATVDPESAIAGGWCASLPFPATETKFDLRPEPFSYWLFLFWHDKSIARIRTGVNSHVIC